MIQNFGMIENLLKLIALHLKNRFQFVKKDDNMSTGQNLTSGIRRSCFQDQFSFSCKSNFYQKQYPVFSITAMLMTTKHLSKINKDFMTLQPHWESN